jgi:hypothetical protein
MGTIKEPLREPLVIKETKTLFFTGLDLFTGDPSIFIEYHASTHISVNELGDYKWVYVSLPLCKGAVIKEIKINYRVSNGRSYLSQIRLVEYTDSDSAVVKHDDGTDHNSTVSAYAISKCSSKVENSQLLCLRLNFGNISDAIVISSIAVKYQE